MNPVQQITLITVKDRRFQTFIVKNPDNNYTFWLHYFDPESKESSGLISEKKYFSQSEAYKEMLNAILQYLASRNKSDSIKYSDNPCNCELIDRDTQTTVVQELHQSFSIKVNGQ